MLPTVVLSTESTPTTVNDGPLADRERAAFVREMGQAAVFTDVREGMGAEDFPYFTTDPPIRSVYFSVGGTPKADIAAEEAGGPKVPSHHSPLFKITPKPAIITGVEATVLALLDLLTK